MTPCPSRESTWRRECGRAVHRRAEHPDDGPFRLELFRETQGEAFAELGVLAGLDATLVETLLLQQFAGQASTYGARYPGAQHDIVELDGTPIGRMVVDRTTEAITLVDIALLAKARGQGVGTELLSDLVAEGIGAGVPVRLSVRRENVAARRLYARMGFAETAASEIDVTMVWAPGFELCT